MPTVFFDANALYIQGYRDSFTAGSLTADYSAIGVGVRVLHGSEYLVNDVWTNYTRQDGTGFASPDELMAYLTAEFGKRRPINTLSDPYVAADDLGGHRIVRAVAGGIAYASANDPETAAASLGLTLGSVMAGNVVQVVTAGPVDEPSWSFAIGPVYLGLDGALTQAPPSAGFVLQVGKALSPTRLLVDLDEPYFLAA